MLMEWEHYKSFPTATMKIDRIVSCIFFLQLFKNATGSFQVISIQIFS